MHFDPCVQNQRLKGLAFAFPSVCCKEMTNRVKCSASPDHFHESLHKGALTHCMAMLKEAILGQVWRHAADLRRQEVHLVKAFQCHGYELVPFPWAWLPSSQPLMDCHPPGRTAWGA